VLVPLFYPATEPILKKGDRKHEKKNLFYNIVLILSILLLSSVSVDKILACEGEHEEICSCTECTDCSLVCEYESVCECNDTSEEEEKLFEDYTSFDGSMTLLEGGFAPMAGHTHSADCYDGDIHNHTGSSSSGGGCYGTYTPGSKCYASLVYSHDVSGSFDTRLCGLDGCSGLISGGYVYAVYYCGTTYKHAEMVTKHWAWSCNKCSNSYVGSPGSVSSSCQYTFSGSYSLNCGKTAGSYYKGSTLVNPTCNTVVTSILPTQPSQTVVYNGSIVNTVTATYLDGHTGTVSSTVSGFNNKSLTTQTVTLTYSGTVNNAKTTGTKTTTTSVTVRDYVTNIVAVNSNQTIQYNGSVNSSATITKASGGNQAVSCTVTGFNPTSVGTQTVTLTYTSGLKTVTNTNPVCTVTVNVQGGLDRIVPTASIQTIYKGGSVVLTARAFYLDGTDKIVTPSNNFNSNLIGTQTVNMTYTDQGVTKTATCTVTVKPNLTGLSVSASSSSVLYGTNITFTCTASYEDGSSKFVTATASSPYVNTTVGSQVVTYSYSENNITRNASVNVEVLDYPVSIEVYHIQDWIYQGQYISIESANALLASGAVKSIEPTFTDYDNLSFGSEEITYSYSMNGVIVERTKQIQVNPDLYQIILSSATFEIYRGQALDIEVTASFHVAGSILLGEGDYSIEGFDSEIYDREGEYYNLSYIDKGVKLTKPIFIRVLPNIVGLNATYPAQTIEGVQIPFVADIEYEDGQIKTLTEADIGSEGTGLSMENYDMNLVGYQDIVMTYTEGGKTVSQTATIRVRTIIKVSIPINALIMINSNTGQVYAPALEIDNQSKESVIVGMNQIRKEDSNMIDVLPGKYTDWSKLGKRDSKNIAIGFYYASGNWMNRYLPDPLYIVELHDTDIGQIDKQTACSLNFLIQHGNSFDNNIDFQYVIEWAIRLAEE
jgi:hypothetical protein